MDNNNAQKESPSRHLRRVCFVASAVILSVVTILIAFGLYSFAITHLELGKNVTIVIGSTQSDPFIRDKAPLVIIHYQGIPSKKISVALDSQKLEVEKRGLWGTVATQLNPMTDGKHTLDITVGSYHQSCSFIVDTAIPTMDLRGPLPNALTAKNSATFFGTTKPSSTVTVKNENGKKTVRHTSDEQGKFNFNIAINNGINSLKWTVCDRAGNKLEGQNTVICDQSGPSVEAEISDPDGSERATPKTLNSVLSNRDLVLKLTLKDLESGVKSAKYSLDGKTPIALKVVPVEADDTEANANEAKAEADDTEAEADNTEAKADDTKAEADNTEAKADNTEAKADNTEAKADDTKAEADDAKAKTDDTSVKAIPEPGQALLDSAIARHLEYTVPLRGLFDGDHTVSIIVTNGVGSACKRVISFKVNSSDIFGEAELYLGAVGEDVTQLQKRLVNRGCLKGKYEDGTYDTATKQAVCTLQTQIGHTPTGICDANTLSALSQMIYVNLSRFEAKLVDDDDKVYTYPVCIGVHDYPTPTGLFYVAEKVKNPTWVPPNSEWAKDSKPIEAGPSNPLGTRWIGLNNGAIGFHGTTAPWSVGTRASHGCMRMLRADVEKLYDQVKVGAQVRIFSGDEDNTALQHYWPRKTPNSTAKQGENS